MTGLSTDRPARYGRTAIALHWIAALLIAAAFGIGAAMVRLDLPLAASFALFELHKSLGLTALLVMMLRLTWRWWHRPPPLPGTFSQTEHRRAAVGHTLLYVAFLAIPVTGWAMATVSTLGLPVMWFGTVRIPSFAGLDMLPLGVRTSLEPWAILSHRSLAWGGLCLVAGHIAFVWWHRRSGRDVLARLSWRR